MLYTNIFDASPVAMALSSPDDGSFYDVNQQWLYLFGINSKKDVIGKSPVEAGFDPSCNAFSKDGCIVKWLPGKYRSVIRNYNGHMVDVQVTVQSVNLERGPCIFAVFEDAGELTRIQSEESRYRQLVESVNEGIWQTDKELKTIFVNEKMAGMLGYKPEEMSGRSIYEFMDAEGQRLMLKKMTDDKRIVKRNFGHKFIRKDGSYIHTAINMTPLFNSHSVYSGSIFMFTDIAERIKMERALRKTRRKLEIALENGNIGTWEWNVKTNEFTCDERSENMLGLPHAVLTGDFAAFESHINEEDLPHFREAMKRALETNLPFETVFRTRPESGDSNYISVKALVSHDRWGKPDSVTGVCFDVTGMKKGAEQVLIRLNEELLRSNNDLKQFAYVASHDLQEPLRMVASFTQLLQQRYRDKLDEAGIEYINYAVEGSKRMYDLLNGLLTYSRIQTRGRIFESVDMNSVLEKVKGNLSLMIREKNVTIKSGALPCILADESQMIQLLQNLVENGIKFSRRSPEINISCETSDSCHMFSIRDQGIGIEAQYFDKIFKIFQRLHRSDEYKGTGIGLAICKRIVERHAGKIWLESAPGKGSVFYFTIPVNE